MLQVLLVVPLPAPPQRRRSGARLWCLALPRLSLMAWRIMMCGAATTLCQRGSRLRYCHPLQTLSRLQQLACRARRAQRLWQQVQVPQQQQLRLRLLLTARPNVSTLGGHAHVVPHQIS